MTRHTLALFADYFQFYLQDDRPDLTLADAWDAISVERMLVGAPGIVGIGTVRNGRVPVTIEVLGQAPAPDPDGFDHIVECSLSIDSGRLVVAGCTDYLPDAKRIALAPGDWRLRAGYAGLDSLSASGLEGDDRYHLQLWPAPAAPVTVVKQRR